MRSVEKASVRDPAFVRRRSRNGAQLSAKTAVTLIGALCLVVVSGSPAWSATVDEYSIEGVVSDDVGPISAGTGVELSFGINTAVQDSDPDETFGDYLNALTYVDVSVGSISGYMEPGDDLRSSSWAAVYDDFGPDAQDGFQARAPFSPRCVTGVWQIARVNILMTDTDGATLTSDDLSELTLEDLRRMTSPEQGVGDFDAASIDLWIFDFCGTFSGFRSVNVPFEIGSVDLAVTDTDGDGILDDVDNCPNVANPDQANFDSDGVGDACDPDDDNDDVLDGDDVCAETIIPDPVIPTSGELGVNRYALTDGDTTFDTTTAENHEIVYTLDDTGGCNATQIADALGLGKSHFEKGITRSVLESWIASLNG